MRYAFLIVAMIVCQQSVARPVLGGVYVRATPTLTELRAIEEARARELERRRRAEEEREIDRIGLELAKMGRSFNGGRPRSASEANAQYAAACRNQLRADRLQDEARRDQALQDARFVQKLAERREAARSRAYATSTNRKMRFDNIGTSKTAKPNACPKCNRGRIKCSACNATRLIQNDDGRGCVPCTQCADGYVSCPDCQGKGVVP